MKGKIVMVTGATQGIGRVAAVELARLGATVVLVARDATRAEEAAKEARAAGGAVEVMLADLSSQESIRKLAAEFSSRHPRLDVLLNNAGAINMTRKLSPDGLEMTFAVNHLGYFLLTHLLLDALKAAGPARIVNVASEAHRGGSIHFDDLQLERGYGGMRAYSQSKLANILFTRELARRLEGTGVTANSLHPGVVRTGFGRNDSGLFSVAVKLAGLFFISPAKGAETSIYLASSPAVEGVSGKYFAKCAEKTPHRRAVDDEAARRLWTESAKLTGAAQAAEASS